MTRLDKALRDIKNEPKLRADRNMRLDFPEPVFRRLDKLSGKSGQPIIRLVLEAAKLLQLDDYDEK